jgi:hypothetical protein
MKRYHPTKTPCAGLKLYGKNERVKGKGRTRKMMKELWLGHEWTKIM